jgi:CDP-diacylglycerol--glycerol-3-phosphate 3-phosphatidyltransferase
MTDPSQQLTMGIRQLAGRFASALNKSSKGKILPAHITALSLAGHGFVAWAFYASRPIAAALGIVVFGLMDSLDGALARIQKTSSLMGMFFDAVSDRIKEVIIYSSLAIFTLKHHPEVAMWMIVAVCGSSLLVSYVKAKGEMAIGDHTADKQALNREFSDGFGRYEIRMFLLVIGIVSDSIKPIMGLLLTINSLTVSMRFIYIGGQLTRIDNQKRR